MPLFPTTLNGFQDEAITTIQHSPKRIEEEWHPAVYHAIGLAEETGEVLGKVKKAVRAGRLLSDGDVKLGIIAEMGDALWYMAALCHDLGITLQDVSDANIMKRNDRQARGVIKGEGDIR